MARITNIHDMAETSEGGKGVSRRTVLASAAGGAALAGTAFAISGAAARQASPAASPAASPGATPKAGQDIYPSGVEGVPDAYLRAPEPFASYDGVPGTGGTVRAFLIGYNPPPPPRDQNKYWQELRTEAWCHMGADYHPPARLRHAICNPDRFW